MYDDSSARLRVVSSASMQPGDAELLERWRAGDLDAGETLFDRYYDMIERFFINKVSTEVRDLVQETFAACVEGRDRIDDGKKFSAYVFAVAYNVLCGYLRQSYRRGREIDFDSISIDSFLPDPGSVIVDRREQRVLLEALRNIPLDYQVILELSYWEDMSSAEIGDILDLPAGTVRSRLRKARELLEQAIQRLSLSPAELQSTLSNLDDWARQCRQHLP